MPIRLLRNATIGNKYASSKIKLWHRCLLELEDGVVLAALQFPYAHHSNRSTSLDDTFTVHKRVFAALARREECLP